MTSKAVVLSYVFFMRQYLEISRNMEAANRCAAQWVDVIHVVLYACLTSQLRSFLIERKDGASINPWWRRLTFSRPPQRGVMAKHLWVPPAVSNGRCSRSIWMPIAVGLLRCLGFIRVLTSVPCLALDIFSAMCRIVRTSTRRDALRMCRPILTSIGSHVFGVSGVVRLSIRAFFLSVFTAALSPLCVQAFTIGGAILRGAKAVRFSQLFTAIRGRLVGSHFDSSRRVVRGAVGVQAPSRLAHCTALY